MAREYIFKDHQAKLAERCIPVRMDDDTVFKILPAELWPDNVVKLAAIDPLTAAEGILEGGHDAYLAYADLGGTAGVLLSIFQEATEASVPELPASSSS